MKVEKIMTSSVESCRANESLAQAVGIMWKKDCGVVPVVNDENAVIGIITDRDVSVAATSQNRSPAEILIGEVINGNPISCLPNDSVKAVLDKMRLHKVKRLPVLSESGELAGIISIADILQLSKKKSLRKPLVKTLEALSKPESILLKEI